MTRVSQANGTPSQTDRSNYHQHHTTRPRAGFFFGDGSDASVTHSLSYASSRKALCSKGFRGLVTDMTDISHIPEFRARSSRHMGERVISVTFAHVAGRKVLSGVGLWLVTHG